MTRPTLLVLLAASGVLACWGCGRDFDDASGAELAPTAGSGGGALPAGGGMAGARSDAGAAGSAGAAPSGGTAGAAGDPGSSGAPCADPTAAETARPVWRDDVFYNGEPELPIRSWQLALESLAAWEPAQPYPDQRSFGALKFTRGIAPPLFLFVRDPGCGVVEATDEGIRFALSSCADVFEVQRELGVALGLRRMHQRTDRDLYLELAPREHFECSRAEYFEIAPLGAGEPEIGPFTFDSVMLPPAARSNPERCALQPDGEYLFLPKPSLAIDREVPDWCWQLVGDQKLTRGAALPLIDRANLAELFAKNRGWQPFVPAPDAHAGTRVAAVAHDGVLTVFTESTEPPGVRLIAGDGTGLRPASHLSLLGAVQGLAAVAPALQQIELVVNTGKELLQRSHDGAWDDAWVSLGGPGADLTGDPAVTAGDGGRLAVYAIASSVIHLSEYDGASWSSWTALAPLPDVAAGAAASNGVSALAAVARGSEQHVIASGVDGPYYSRRDAGVWSPWTPMLAYPRQLMGTPALIALPDQTLHAFMISLDRALWHAACPEFVCAPDALGHWDLELIGGAVDSVAAAARSETDILLVAPRSHAYGLPVLWHRERRP